MVNTQAEFRAQVREIYVPNILSLISNKGEQYSEDASSPALANFTEPAQVLGHTPAHHLMTLATKQWFVICSWSNDGSAKEAVKREIRQRIYDVIVYMLLLMFMLDGENNDEDALDISG